MLSIPSPQQPFSDASHGNLVIETSDGTRLYVKKERIVHAIPFFATMLTLPNGSSNASGEKPVVRVHEPVAVWSHLAALSHFTPEMPITDLGSVHALLDAGRKYEVDSIPTRIRYALLQPDLLDKEPFMVYVLATSYGFTDTSLLAARSTLKLCPPYGPDSTVLENVSAAVYHRLLDYRRRCGESASKLARMTPEGTLPEWIAKEQSRWKHLTTTCHGPCARDCKTLLVHETGPDSPMVHVRIRTSWIVYLETLSKELEGRPEPQSASAPVLLEPIIISSSRCAQCVKSIYGSAVAFSGIMSSEIEQQILSIPVDS